MSTEPMTPITPAPADSDRLVVPKGWDESTHALRLTVLEQVPLYWDPTVGFADLAIRLALAQLEFDPVHLDRVGRITFEKKGGGEGAYSYNYSSLGEIIRSIGPALARNGIARLGGVRQEGDRVRVSSMLVFEDQWIACELAFQVKSIDPKKIGSAISYGRRYTLSALVGIASEEDDDADGAAPSSRDTGRGSRGGGSAPKKNLERKPEALALIAAMKSWPDVADVSSKLREEFPKAVREDEEVVSKYAAMREHAACETIGASVTRVQLAHSWSSFPKSVQQAETVTTAHAEILARIDADKAQGHAEKGDSA